MTDRSGNSIEGGCICGAVRYRVSGQLADVIACHCRECRRMSGHYYAATAASQEAFEITETSGLAWFGSSKSSRRGFCRVCGSSLFFDHGPNEPVGIAAGSIDGKPTLKLAAHIYVDEAGDYYAIDDNVEQFDSLRWRNGGWDKLRHDDPR
ncbi:GFA family protein [Pelagibius sp. Alg239-R121]|uniref:GFA family protein n=1 Tax=Pelagibius sp. Alg239-R121 TaxID=2993448 RepID=UPI0024A75C09|nr:GFA family protein [Pelagibius sp. Alg239-R121]